MRNKFIIIAIISVSILVGCNFSPSESSDQSTNETAKQSSSDQSSNTKDNTKIGFVSDAVGLGDGSFNDGTYLGIQRAENDFEIDVYSVESTSQTDYMPNLTGMADDGADLVFAVGFLMQDAAMESAKRNPDTHYAVVDVEYGDDAPDNLLGISFREEEVGYLAGIVAGHMTAHYYDRSELLNQEPVVGAILGMEIPPVIRFAAGYEHGVKSVCPNCKVLKAVTGTFEDQAKGKEASIELYNQGADIIFSIAGVVGFGVFAAAQEYNFAAIGVDIDQSNYAPNHIITSAIKKLDTASYFAIKDYLGGSLKGSNSRVYGIAEGGVDLAPYHGFDTVVPQNVKDDVEKAKKMIASGDLIVSKTY